MPEPDLKILFIGGCGRSGSTLLDNILGQLPGFFSAGEIQYLWDRSLLEDRLCSCGAPFSRCELWREVRADCLEGLGQRELQEMIRVREALTPRRVMTSRLKGRSPRVEGLERYAERLAALYRSLARITGSRVIVDSSKSPGHGYLLRLLAGVEASALHLIRDSRAVAYSWMKKKVYDPSGEAPMYMTRHSPLASSRIWTLWNLATEIVWRRPKGSLLRLRYEDFIDGPRPALERALKLLGEPVGELPLAGERHVVMGSLHALAGNPSRFETGPVELRRDDAWKTRFEALPRLQVTALTWPLLLRYGYRL